MSGSGGRRENAKKDLATAAADGRPGDPAGDLPNDADAGVGCDGLKRELEERQLVGPHLGAGEELGLGGVAQARGPVVEDLAVGPLAAGHGLDGEGALLEAAPGDRAGAVAADCCGEYVGFGAVD